VDLGLGVGVISPLAQGAPSAVLDDQQRKSKEVLSGKSEALEVESDEIQLQLQGGPYTAMADTAEALAPPTQLQ
jgi:hypothetical protein